MTIEDRVYAHQFLFSRGKPLWSFGTTMLKTYGTLWEKRGDKRDKRNLVKYTPVACHILRNWENYFGFSF